MLQPRSLQRHCVNGISVHDGVCISVHDGDPHPSSSRCHPGQPAWHSEGLTGGRAKGICKGKPIMLETILTTDEFHPIPSHPVPSHRGPVGTKGNLHNTDQYSTHLKSKKVPRGSPGCGIRILCFTCSQNLIRCYARPTVQTSSPRRLAWHIH